MLPYITCPAPPLAVTGHSVNAVFAGLGDDMVGGPTQGAITRQPLSSPELLEITGETYQNVSIFC